MNSYLLVTTLGLFACVGLGMLLFVAAVVWWLLRAPSAAELDGEEADARVWVDEQVGALAAWEAGGGSLGALAARLEGESLKSARAFRWRGTVGARSGDASLIAFGMFSRAGRTRIVAATSARRWRVEVDGRGTLPGVVRFEVDAAELGRWTPPDGALIAAGGGGIGRASRARGNSEPWEVTIRDHPMGAVSPCRKGAEAEDLLLRLAPDASLDEEAESWLTGLAIVEVAYFSVLGRTAEDSVDRSLRIQRGLEGR